MYNYYHSYYNNIPMCAYMMYHQAPPLHMPMPLNVSNSFNDYGKEPFALDLYLAAKQNNAYRTVIWTGDYFQVTLMSIDVGDDIGLEVHPKTNQFTYIVGDQGLIQMGDSKNNLSYNMKAIEGFAMIVPAGTWHNITNTGNTPLKMYTIYAPIASIWCCRDDKIRRHTIEGS